MTTLTRSLYFLLFSIATAANAQVIPKVTSGTVVIYSNGDVEKLIRKSSDTAIWEDGRKRVYERSLIGFYGDRVETRFPPGSTTITRRTDEQSLASLIKGGAGNKLNFTVVRDRDGSSSQRHWECTFNGYTTATLLANPIKTEDYTCARYSLTKNSGLVVKERREIQYSNELHLVIWERRTRPGRDASVRTIAAILPPKQATIDAIATAVKNTN